MVGTARLSSYSMRSKLLLLLLIVFLPALGITVASGLERRSREIEDAKHDALVLVESLASQQEQLVAGAKQMLSTLAHLPEVRNLNAEACSNLFHELREQNPFYSTIAATSPDGAIFASSPAIDPGSINISERKYIKADRVTLSFRRVGNSLELAITDNGVGFDPAGVSARRSHKGGIGLASMRERVGLSGGSFSISSTPGEGTRVRACWDIGKLV